MSIFYEIPLRENIFPVENWRACWIILKEMLIYNISLSTIIWKKIQILICIAPSPLLFELDLQRRIYTLDHDHIFRTFICMFALNFLFEFSVTYVMKLTVIIKFHLSFRNKLSKILLAFGWQNNIKMMISKKNWLIS